MVSLLCLGSPTRDIVAEVYRRAREACLSPSQSFEPGIWAGLLVAMQQPQSWHSSSGTAEAGALSVDVLALLLDIKQPKNFSPDVLLISAKNIYLCKSTRRLSVPLK